jgi:hypothetical protein
MQNEKVGDDRFGSSAVKLATSGTLPLNPQQQTNTSEVALWPHAAVDVDTKRRRVMQEVGASKASVYRALREA